MDIFEPSEEADSIRNGSSAGAISKHLVKNKNRKNFFNLPP